MVLEFVRKGWSVVVLLGFHSSSTQRVVDACRQQGAAVEMIPAEAAYVEAGYVNLDTSLSAIKNGGGTKKSTNIKNMVVLRGLRRMLRNMSLTRLFQLPGLVYQCFRRRQIAEQLVFKHQPAAAILGPYHSSGQIDNAIARALRHRDIPMYCIPNSPYLGATHVGRLNHLEQGMASPVITVRYDIVNRSLARMFPGWTATLPNGCHTFYWDPIQMLAATMAGLQMDRCWLKPSLSFKQVFVHSEFSRDLLARDGYPPDRIVVSGPPLLDAVLDRIGDNKHELKMFSHIQLPVMSPFLLFNVEPSAEHLYCDWEKHWVNFHETMASVVNFGLPVVLSLHPLCKLETYKFAEKQYGVVISTAFRIHDLYPYCAISVSFPCSTNLLAPIFKKPLVIYDNFRILSRDEESRVLLMVPGALVGESAHEIAEHIRIFLNEEDCSQKENSQTQACGRAAEIIYATIAADVSRN